MFDCTTDELVNAYKGKVQNWRIQRSLTNLMVRCWVDKGFDIMEHVPLPFDDELQAGETSDEEIVRIYNETIKGNGG